MTTGPALRYSVDLRTETYTEPVLLKYGKLATKYPSTYGCYKFLHCTANTHAVMPIDDQAQTDRVTTPTRIGLTNASTSCKILVRIGPVTTEFKRAKIANCAAI